MLASRTNKRGFDKREIYFLDCGMEFEARFSRSLNITIDLLRNDLAPEIDGVFCTPLLLLDL